MIQNIIQWARTHKHRVATLALVLGFVMDLITFRNLNLSISQIILAAHLCIVAFSILIIALQAKEEAADTLFTRIRSWIPILHQYSTGALLSAFLVIYTVSSSLLASWVFIAFLAAAIAGNELLRLQKYRLPFQTSVFFLNLLLFAALFVPITLGGIGTLTFLASALVAAAVFAVFFWLGKVVAREAFAKNKFSIQGGAALVGILLITLYFTNLIPPIPLSLKDGGFYHSVARSGSAYVVEDEERGWLERFFDVRGTTLHLASGERAYTFTAVFAPTDFNTNIVHRWQHYNEEAKAWETRNTVQFSISGGRNGGYRGYSFTDNPAPGRWRVSVETARGAVIGRRYLIVERVAAPVHTTKTFLD